MDNFIDKLAQKFTAGEVIRANSVAEERELKRLREQVAEYERCLQEMRKVQMRNTETAQNLQQLMAESRKNFDNIARESLAKIGEAGIQADQTEKKAMQSVEAVEKVISGLEAEISRMSLEMESLAAALVKSQKDMTDTLAKSQIDMESVLTKNQKGITEVLTRTQTDMESALAKNQADMESALAKNQADMESVLAKNQTDMTDTLAKNQQEISEWFKQADDFLHKENVKVYRNVQAVVVEEVGNKTENILKAQENNVKKYSSPTLILAVLTFLAAAAGLVMQILNLFGMI